ncbi:HAD-IA family hydrolase [Catenovulum maritimum]|uniref:HAD family hydrolase n=1 Tax=Catenovulum maritimum TaxID=1513271 RepID=A0A0J8GYA0_9ALTE|nr:HAD-IA family hydrolase [Catenovulum maritimum]KMT66214.1 hypothetical protein XM47_04225 [Catenovulum maritimum]
MKFYRRISQPKLLSFDLDDTLYDNVPIIQNAENKLSQYLSSEYACFKDKTQHDWLLERITFAKLNPALRSDVSKLRLAFLEQAFRDNKIANPVESAHQAFLKFYHWRNNFKVKPEVVDILMRLKKNYTLVAVTNGNAEPDLIGLEGCFTKVYQPKDGLRMKPETDMFDILCEQLSLQSKDILHIGDSPSSDIYGAQSANCRTAWYNPKFQSYPLHGLPDMEFNQLSDLLYFVYY